jgi:hypothetical protein
MASCGLDRVTGLPITDLAHVAQHVETLYATRLGQMIIVRARHDGGRRVGDLLDPALVDLEARLALVKGQQAFTSARRASRSTRAGSRRSPTRRPPS